MLDGANEPIGQSYSDPSCVVMPENIGKGADSFIIGVSPRQLSCDLVGIYHWWYYVPPLLMLLIGFGYPLHFLLTKRYKRLPD